MKAKPKRVKTPIVMQMEATECGAAALAIILGYFGRHIPLEQLRIDCGVSRDGSKAINMLRSARRYGLIAQGAKMEPEHLHEVQLPLIAFWEFNHFVVIEGIVGKTVYLNDPATGPRTVTQEDFDRSFTGVVLMFETSPEFKTGGSQPSLFKSLIPRIKKVRSALLFIILMSITLIIPGILIPSFTKIFIDDILIQHLSGWLLPLLWGLFLAGVLRLFFSYIQQYYLLRLQLKIVMTSSARFLWHVLRLPYLFYTQRFAGDIQSRIQSNDRIANWISGDLSTSVVSLISMIFYAIIMFLFDWSLALLGVIVAIVNASLLFHIGQHIKTASYRLQQQFGKLAGVEMSGLCAIETIKATSSEDAFFERWSGYHALTINSQQKIFLYTRTLQIIPPMLTGLMMIIILGLGGWRIMQGFLTIGGLVAFQTLLMSFNAPLVSMIAMGNNLQQLRGDLLRLEDVNNHPEDIRLVSKDQNITELPKFKGKLQMSQVSFGYSPLEPPLLHDMDLLLEPGKRIAIVGSSGSGKSTLAKLLCGLYQPWSGTICYDDIALPDISAAALAHSLAFVEQDIFLFEGTVRQNLTLWDTTIPQQALDEAIHDADLNRCLALRSHRLDSHVAPAGTNFSGGQRQQLEIARALAMQPTLLILDEATASLDAITEQVIMDNIKQRGISLLLIAHRLSTIRDCDEIIVLDKGNIVERGTHQQLYQQQGYYHQLLQNQTGDLNAASSG